MIACSDTKIDPEASHLEVWCGSHTHCLHSSNKTGNAESSAIIKPSLWWLIECWVGLSLWPHVFARDTNFCISSCPSSLWPQLAFLWLTETFQISEYVSPSRTPRPSVANSILWSYQAIAAVTPGPLGYLGAVTVLHLPTPRSCLGPAYQR